MKNRLAKSLLVTRIHHNEKTKPHAWDGRKVGPWDKKIKKADGGDVDKPAFDPTQPFQDADSKPPFDPSKPFTATPDAPTTPDKGILHALGHGAAAGATFNFSDELAGVRGAGSDNVPDVAMAGPLPIPARTLAGAARLAKNWIVGGDPDAIAAYEKARDAERQEIKSAQEHHPIAYGAGELGGSIPAMAALPEADFLQAGRIGSQMLKGVQVGAEYGGLSGIGEGTDATSRAAGAAEGVVGGGIGGATAPLGGAIASKAYDKFGKPLVNLARGLIDPEAEAARRLSVALRADQDLISQGKADGMSPTDWIKSRANGEPVTLADLGSSNTQALLRSAANTSPEGRAVLEKVINDRFANQSDRVANDVRGLVAGGANAGKTADQLVAEYDQARVPAYRQAYKDGDKEIMSPTMERLMGSPMFEQAMKSAITSGKDRAITEGLGAFNPGIKIEPGGGFVFTKTKPNGGPVYPNLQYWDAVKKELDSAASVAARSGDKGKADVAGNMANTLRSELDKQVPSYANARGIAAQYFGESNALEAGCKLAGKQVDPAAISQVMRQMKPDERELFKEGYASDWANRVIGNIRDSRDITKAMFNSPNERARALAVFGPAGMAHIQARMTLETIMDGARKAMGNSTTARQLIEAGLAGGAVGGYEGYQHGGLWGALQGAGATGTGAAFARRHFADQIAKGAGKLIGHVDATTARNVAELLTSNDPNKLAKGLRMAAKNQKIGDGLRSIANRVALAGQQEVTSPLTHLVVHPLQGPGAAVGAQNEQQSAPRVGQQ